MNTNTKPKLLKDLGIKQKSGYNVRFGIYLCHYCESTFVARTGNVKTGNTSKCRDCSISINMTKHGDATKGKNLNRLYTAWQDLIARCENKATKSYKNYGARGICVCIEWHDYQVFKEWALKNGYDKTLTIDRINNDKGYSPDNCRFSTMSVQAANKRKSPNTTSKYLGVSFDKNRNKWMAQVCYKGVRKNLGRFLTQRVAATCRDDFIINNNLPHALNFKREIL